MPTTNADADEKPDELVPDSEVSRELGDLSKMTLYRWDRDPEMAELGWPPRIEVRKRNYRFRKQLEKFKKALLRRAIEQRRTKATPKTTPIETPPA
jgi:hypothetical protein